MERTDFMNFSLISYYENIALDTVLTYAKEQGIKLRRGDFFLCEDEDERKRFKNWDAELARQGVYRDKSRVTSVWQDKYATGIVYVHLYYKTGSLAGRLKGKIENFLNYRYVMLDEKEGRVTFTFTKNDLDIIAADRDTNDTDKDRIEKVMRQITQLLKFTEENGATEAEAISASAKVQMLLAKYHLSLAEVTGESRDKEDITEVTAVAGTGKRWKYDLAGAVADGYCCKCWFVGSDRIVFYGYETDILAARRVFVYLFKVGDKLANQYVRQEREYRYSAAGVYNSFVSGFIRGIRNEFEKNCTALALIVQPEVEESYKAVTETFKTANLHLSVDDNFDPDAEEQGFLEGRRALTGRYLAEGAT